MQIDIQAQNTEIHPRWRAMIQRRAAKLAELSSRVIRLHVTLVHSTHHLHGNEEVRLLATVPNDTLRVQKMKASMGDAIQAAFSAMEREVQDRLERRKPRMRRADGPLRSGATLIR